MPCVNVKIDADDFLEQLDPVDVVEFCESAVMRMGTVDQQTIIDAMDDEVVIEEARIRQWSDGEIDGAIEELVDAARYGTHERLLAAVERLAYEARGVTLVLTKNAA